MKLNGKFFQLLFFYLTVGGCYFCEGLEQRVSPYTCNESNSLSRELNNSTASGIATEILWDAIERNDPSRLHAALESGADFGRSNSTCQSPLHRSADLGYVEVTSVLLRAGADMEAKDADGDRPLHLAASSGRRGTVALLASAGADLHARSGNGSTPLLRATLNRHNGTIALLRSLIFTFVQKGVVLNSEATEALWTAVKKNDSAAIKSAVENGADLKKRDKDSGRTPLHWATAECAVDLVGVLLSYGAPVDAIDTDGNTPLHRAALEGCNGAVTKLVEAGANIKAVGYNGLTPLQKAERNGQRSAAQLLKSLSS